MRSSFLKVLVLSLASLFLFVACGDDENDDPVPQEGACTQNSDCAGGMICQGGTCVASEVCETPRCRNGALEVCENGAFVAMNCPDQTECLEDDAGARCADMVCTPNSKRCKDQQTAIACNENGTSGEETNCGDDSICVEGECEERVCGAAFEVGCFDDTTAYSCDGASRVTMLPCADGERCENSVCTSQVCLPELVICEGNTLLICNEDGSAEQQVDCTQVTECQNNPELECVCEDGACISR